MIACAMVVACVALVVRAPGSTAGGHEMFFGVVQLANTICSGVAGMALGPMLMRGRSRDLTATSDRPKMGPT